MKKYKYKVSFVLPCLNEELTLEKTIYEIKKVIEENNLKAEIIVVDNGSTDNSFRIAKSLGINVFICKDKGYGNALRFGFRKANGEYIIMGDADTTYNFHDSIIMIEKLDDGFDFVMGNRYLGGMEKRAMKLSHFFGVKFLSFVGRLKYGVELGDFHCGLRGFKASLLKKVNFTSTGMEFATEMIAKFKNFKVCEIPTELRRCHEKRKNHLRTIRDGFRHLSFIILKK